ncbi:hypothetical protein FA13DRAFT_1735903 [Coprinellus micaceus]|uniref:F-box domain-containing protein n=1 Tax=Coprinellus micaceus TaxID=71717 RepID=A0A4Y7T1G3_COPMI|nr:hypothetical protein FA13DRAFT_1735903 [Coprinellus micaceus]
MANSPASQPMLLENPLDGRATFPLSGEIVIEILRHASPFDVLSMRKTCRFICNVTRMRTVWINALERVCARHGVFKPTFPLQRMSILDLEYASLGPRRFLKMLNSIQGDESPLPYGNRELIFRRRPPLTGAYPCDGFYMATGGRFLLVYGEDDSLSLWDLGYNLRAPMKTYPVATLERSGELAAASQSFDGEGILLVTRQPTTDFEMDNLAVYEVRPTSDGRDSTFVKLAQLGLDGSPTLHDVRITPRVVSIRCGPLFFVWDWRINKGCRWSSSTLFNSPARAMTVLEGTILAYDEGGTVYNWDIPALQHLPILDLAHFPSIENEPKACIRPLVQHPEISVLIRCTASHRQNTEPALDPILCILYDDDSWNGPPERRTPMSLYSVREMGRGNEDPFIPNTLLLPAGSCDHAFGDRSERFYGAMTSLYRCEDNLVFCADTNDLSVVVTVMPTPLRATLRELPPAMLSRKLLPSDALHGELTTGVQLGFCPVSGRLAYRATDESFYLRDFISAPE